MVINVTKDQIVCRMSMTDKLMWAPPAEKTEADNQMDPIVSQGRTPAFVKETAIK